MARITTVKSAQQRYETKPVLDAEGNPVRIPLTRQDGTPKTDKRGRPITIGKTVADKAQPKPLMRCDFPACEHPERLIQVGQSYKWIKPKSGPYGGRLMARHAEHPSWNVWDYSSSLSARTAQISHDADESFPETATEPDEISDWAAQVAEEIRSLAEEKREAADNIRDGFGHDTYQSEELDQVADDLDGWADDVEGMDVPELPEPEEEDCDACGGTGEQDVDVEGSDEPNVEPCEECDGSGQVTSEEPTQEQMDEWLEECRSAGSDLVNECPV